MFFHWKSQNIDIYEKKVSQLSEKIGYLFSNKNSKGIRYCIKNNPISILVEALEKYSNVDAIIFFLISSKKKMGDLFLALSPDTKLCVLEKIHIAFLNELLENLNADDISQLLEKVPKDLYKKIIVNASATLRNEIKKIKQFEHTQIGSIMNTTILKLNADMQVHEAINYIRRMKNQFDIEQEIYIVNNEDEVKAKVKTQELLFSELQDVNILDIAEKSHLSVNASEDIENVINLFRKFNLNTIAIINDNNQLLGIVNDSDIVPEIFSENTENIYKLYGMREVGESYMTSNVWDIVKSRIFWLLMMLFAATFTTLAIDKFESLGVTWTAGISSAILVPIIPIITDMCGNTGSQTTATVIQGIASGEIKKDHFWKVLSKELKVSTIIGIILAIFNFLRLVIYFLIIPIDNSKLHFGNSSSPALVKLFNFIESYVDTRWLSSGGKNGSTTICPRKLFKISLVGAFASSISLFLVVILSKLFGVFIPFISIKLNYDPASFSTPVLTTVLDTVASVIFFFIGTSLIYCSIQPILDMTVSDGKLQAATSVAKTAAIAKTYLISDNYIWNSLSNISRINLN